MGLKWILFYSLWSSGLLENYQVIGNHSWTLEPVVVYFWIFPAEIIEALTKKKLWFSYIIYTHGETKKNVQQQNNMEEIVG